MKEVKRLSIAEINEKPSKIKISKEISVLLGYKITELIEKDLEAWGYFSGAFTLLFLSMIYFWDGMYDMVRSYKITITRIDKDNWLGACVFIHGGIVMCAENSENVVLVDIFQILILEALIKAGERKQYNVPQKAMDYLYERRSKLGQIPEWIPEMETNPQLVIDLYKASVPKPK